MSGTYRKVGRTWARCWLLSSSPLLPSPWCWWGFWPRTRPSPSFCTLLPTVRASALVEPPYLSPAKARPAETSLVWRGRPARVTASIRRTFNVSLQKRFPRDFRRKSRPSLQRRVLYLGLIARKPRSKAAGEGARATHFRGSTCAAAPLAVGFRWERRLAVVVVVAAAVAVRAAAVPES